MKLFQQESRRGINMQQRMIMVLFICLFLLVGCNNNDGLENNSMEPIQEDKPKTDEVQSDQEVVDEQEEIIEENTNNEVEENTDNEIEENLEKDGIDKEQLLLNAAQAMGELTSMKVESEIISNRSNRYQDSTITWNTQLEIMFAENHMLIHEFLTVEDDRGEPMNLELYVTPDSHFSQNPDHNPGEWTEEASFMGGYQHFNLLNAGNLIDYASFAEQFEWIEETDHYTLTFSGSDDDAFKEQIYLGFAHQVDEVINNSESEIEMTGTFEMTIAKETFYVTAWQMTFDATTTTEETGEYHNIEEASYIFSDFGEYDELVIPDEVINSANE